MVLEALLTAKIAEKQSWRLFILGMIYASFGMLIASWVFPDHASIVMVFTTVLAAAHIMHEIVNYEESQDEEKTVQFDILEHHMVALWTFLMLFFGMTVAYTFWYAVLDPNLVSSLFATQNRTVAQIVGGLATGNAVLMDRFNLILLNNLRVLLVSFIFGLAYGYGAIFVLTWNASIIAAAAGSSFKAALVSSGGGPLTMVLAFLGSLGQYALHGIPEMFGFFMGGLAAGILGVALARRLWSDKDRFSRVLIDVAELAILAVITIFIAAVIEVWITPLLIF